MYRGRLSAQSAPTIAIDFRILVEPKYGYGWFARSLPQMMLDSGMDERVRKLLPLRKGAKRWLERNWERRFCVVTVAQPMLVPTIELIVGDLVAEFEHFDDAGELRTWLKQTPEIARLYTMDPALLGLDETVRPFSGWGERV